MDRPNILYLHSHDTGRQIEPYGYAVPTPHLMQLARSGVLFRKVFCAAPTCSPSRAALLTGQSAHSSGMIGLAHRGFGLKDYKQHLVHTLREAGYRSTLIGVQHVAEDASMIGYDDVADIATNRAESVAPAAAEFLASHPEQPFFLDVGFFETHREFPVGQRQQEDVGYCMPFSVLPDTPETREDVAAFMASARLLDQGVGLILGALDEAGLTDDTLVIYTTDHGPAFPGMKCTLTDHGIGVSLIMRWPQKLEAGRIIDAMISQIDVFPTLCEMLEISPPTWLTGRSFASVLDGSAEEVNEEVFAEVTFHAAYEPKRAVRTQRFKYIRRYDDRGLPVLPNVDDSLSKDVLLAYGLASRPLANEELYDLVFDPGERANVANDSAYQIDLESMRARLDRWMRDTKDPLLDGRVAAPVGAQINDPNGLSPRDPVYTVEA